MKLKSKLLRLYFVFLFLPLICSAASSLGIVVNEIAWPVKAAYAANGLKMGTVLINEICWPVKAAYAANGLKMGTVLINEICWMGTALSANDEWIELYNNTNKTVSLEGWELISQDKRPIIELKGEIKPQGFFLLERTNDESVADAKADLIYTGALNNEGEYLKLIDELGNSIDEIDCQAGWFFGDNQTKQTMERKSPSLIGRNENNWQTSESPGGTPKKQNGLGERVPLEENGFQETPQDDSQTLQPLKEKELTANQSQFFLEETLDSEKESSEQGGQKDFLFSLFLGLMAAFVSGASILLIRRKLKGQS